MSMQSILAASQSMSTMQTMQSAKTQLSSQASILRNESRQDGGNPNKEAKAATLDTQANDLMSDLMVKVNQVNETLKPEETTKPEETAKPEETTKQPNTDKIVITKPATGEEGAEGAEAAAPTEVAIGEPVMYKANGSLSPKVAVKKSSDIDVSA